MSNFLNSVISGLSFSTETWMTIIIGIIGSFGIAYMIYRLQKKESIEHKQDHDAKLDRLEQLHLQDSEKINVLYELILKSQRGSISEMESNSLEEKIEIAADKITDQDSEHAQTLKAIAGNQKAEADDLLAKLAQREHDLAELYDMHAMNEYRAGNYADSVTWLHKLVELQPENSDYKERLFDSLNQAANFAEAEKLANTELDRLKNSTNPDTQDIVSWLYNLGSVFLRREQPNEAEANYNEALQLGIKEFGAEYPKLYNLYNDLGIIYKDKENFEKAEEYYRTALKIKSNETEQDLITTAYITCNLASLYQNQGKIQEAEELFKDGMKSMLELLGENHPVLTYFYNNLGALYHSQGKFKEAEELIYKAKLVFENKHMTSHPGYMYITNAMGLVCFAQGKLDEAKECFLKSLELGKQIFGKKNPMSASALYNLSSINFRQGQLEEAEKLAKDALEILENMEFTGPKYESTNNTAMLHKHIASINIQQKKLADAEDNLNKSNAILSNLVDKESMECVTNNQNLAYVYFHTERYDEADKLFLEILPYLEKNMSNTPFYSTSLLYLADIRTIQGRQEEAEAYRAKAEELKAGMEQ